MDPAFCVPNGAGAHQASFWHSADAGADVSMGAEFYQTPDCPGGVAYDSLGAGVNGDGWQQLSGVLLAPAGTQSALFKCLAAGTHNDPGQASVQNLRIGCYAITAGLPVQDRVPVAFDELAPQRNPDCAWTSAADRYGR